MTNPQSEGFKRWLEKARASGSGELVWFANGVEQDRPPLEKAVESQWSQGQTEGPVNRLKFLKRHMDGRANFDVLRFGRGRLIIKPPETAVVEQTLKAPYQRIKIGEKLDKLHQICG